jgi:hypothetical protein
VTAIDSSTVRAYDSSTVTAIGSSTVRAYDSSTVTATEYVAVHLHSSRVTVDGGVVIDVTAIDTKTAEGWIDYNGVSVIAGRALVYKAVDAELNAGQGHNLTAYAIGSTVTAPDWRADGECGHGLHFGASPSHAHRYFQGDGQPRYLECEVDAAAIVALGDKIKAPSCRVLREVTEHMQAVTS